MAATGQFRRPEQVRGRLREGRGAIRLAGTRDPRYPRPVRRSRSRTKFKGTLSNSPIFIKLYNQF